MALRSGADKTATSINGITGKSHSAAFEISAIVTGWLSGEKAGGHQANQTSGNVQRPAAERSGAGCGGHDCQNHEGGGVRLISDH
jgi:hypothetical protein